MILLLLATDNGCTSSTTTNTASGYFPGNLVQAGIGSTAIAANAKVQISSNNSINTADSASGAPVVRDLDQAGAKSTTTIDAASEDDVPSAAAAASASVRNTSSTGGDSVSNGSNAQKSNSSNAPQTQQMPSTTYNNAKGAVVLGCLAQTGANSTVKIASAPVNNATALLLFQQALARWSGARISPPAAASASARNTSSTGGDSASKGNNAQKSNSSSNTSHTSQTLGTTYNNAKGAVAGGVKGQFGAGANVTIGSSNSGSSSVTVTRNNRNDTNTLGVFFADGKWCPPGSAMINDTLHQTK